MKYMLQVLKFAKIMFLSVLLYSLLFNLKDTLFSANNDRLGILDGVGKRSFYTQ